MTTKIIHECSQSENIKQIRDEIRQLEMDVAPLRKEVDTMYHILEGNGRQGLKELVIRLDENVTELGHQIAESKNDRKSLRESINDLINFQTTVNTSFEQQDMESSKREVRKAHLQWLIGVVITLLLGVSALLLDLRKEKKQITVLKEQIELSK